ncbi:dienelactone hydrolase family protein [Phenylobacterium sp.]|uniref:dienelactone hydrolase family protein n=1 Tax=Phenylobacterium sp. TaxID=1871053 RepID=UPI002F3F9A04
MTGLRTIDYGHDGHALQGQLATPAVGGPHPAVLVMHDARGLGELVRRRAQALAELGYVALAADMYGGGVFHADAPQGGTLMHALHDEPGRLRGRVLAGFEALKAQPGVDPARIGAIGFCFGGQCVLELARSGADVKSVVSFHGLLTSALPARPGAVKAKVLVLTGARDPYAPPDHVDGLREEMTRAGADWQVTVYGEGWHAFTDPSASEMTNIPGVRYDPLLDKLSWAQAMAMLEATLR